MFSRTTRTPEIYSWLKTEANLDPRVQIEFKGEDKEQKKASAFLGRAFGIALFLMAIILVTAQQVLLRVPNPLRRHYVNRRRHAGPFPTHYRTAFGIE